MNPELAILPAEAPLEQPQSGPGELIEAMLGHVHYVSVERLQQQSNDPRPGRSRQVVRESGHFEVEGQPARPLIELVLALQPSTVMIYRGRGQRGHLDAHRPLQWVGGHVHARAGDGALLLHDLGVVDGQQKGIDELEPVPVRPCPHRQLEVDQVGQVLQNDHPAAHHVVGGRRGDERAAVLGLEGRPVEVEQEAAYLLQHLDVLSLEK